MSENMLDSDLKGHGIEADFLGFLNKSVPHESLALLFEPFQFCLRIRGDIRNRKTTRLPIDTIFFKPLKVHKIENFFDSDFGICVISLLVMHK